MSERYEDLGGQTHPAPTLPAGYAWGCGKDPNLCNHPDGHRCPFLDVTDWQGRAIRCGCTHEMKEGK